VMRRMWIVPTSLLALSMGEPVKLNKNLHIQVVDKEGITHKFSGILCNGRDYLRVKEGSVEYSVPFENVRQISVLSQRGESVYVKLILTNGVEKEIALSSNTYCTSQSELGKAGFYIRDVRDIFIERGEKR